MRLCDVIMYIVDTGGHGVGIIIPDRWRKRPDTDGYWSWRRAIHGPTS